MHEAVRLGATLKQKEKDRIKVISLVLAPTRDVKESLRKTYNEGLKRGIKENRVERSRGTTERLSSLKLIQSERC